MKHSLTQEIYRSELLQVLDQIISLWVGRGYFCGHKVKSQRTSNTVQILSIFSTYIKISLPSFHTLHCSENKTDIVTHSVTD